MPDRIDTASIDPGAARPHGERRNGLCVGRSISLCWVEQRVRLNILTHGVRSCHHRSIRRLIGERDVIERRKGGEGVDISA
jgi:hypothetical protein